MKRHTHHRTTQALLSAGLVRAMLGLPLAAVAQANPCAAGTRSSRVANACAVKAPCGAKSPCAAKNPCAAEEPFATK